MLPTLGADSFIGQLCTLRCPGASYLRAPVPDASEIRRAVQQHCAAEIATDSPTDGNSGSAVGQLRRLELSGCRRLGGGAGRTRTNHQSVMEHGWCPTNSPGRTPIQIPEALLFCVIILAFFAGQSTSVLLAHFSKQDFWRFLFCGKAHQ